MLVYSMNLKKIGKVLTSKSVGTGPSSYEKIIYRAVVSQRLRNTALNGPYPWPLPARFFIPSNLNDSVSLLHQHCHRGLFTVHSRLSQSSVTMKITLEHRVSLQYRCFNTAPTRSNGSTSEKVFNTNRYQICEKVLSNMFHSRHKNMPNIQTQGKKKKKKKEGA